MATGVIFKLKILGTPQTHKEASGKFPKSREMAGRRSAENSLLGETGLPGRRLRAKCPETVFPPKNPFALPIEAFSPPFPVPCSFRRISL